MTTNQARKWIIMSSLLATGSIFTFFVIAPSVGFPLEYHQAGRFIEILIPVFLGYLGSAANFVFSSADTESKNTKLRNPTLVGLLVQGPIIVFSLVVMAALVGFGLSNRRGGPPSAGLSVNDLAVMITAALGLLTVTTNVAVSYLFAGHAKAPGVSSTANLE